MPVLTVLALVAALVCGVYTWQLFAQPSEYRGHYHGDLATELDAFTAGLNFAHCGFWPLKLMPATGGYLDDCALVPRDFYTHFPGGPHLMSGVLQELGLRHYLTQRAAMYLVNLAALGLLVLCVRRITDDILPGGGALAGRVALAIVLASPWFIYWAGSLGERSYGDLLVFLGLWLLLRNCWWGFALVAFVLGFFSYELIPFLFCLGVYKVFHDWRGGALTGTRAARLGLLFFLAPTAAVGIHLLQNVWFFGGWDGALADVAAIAQKRAGLSGQSQYSLGAHVAKQTYAAVWFYGGTVVVLAGVGAWLCWGARRPWPLVLLLAGGLWQVVMRQHCGVHAFTARHFGPGLILLAVIGVTWLLRSPARHRRALGYALLAVCVLRLPLGAEVSQHPVWLRVWQTVVQRTDSATLFQALAEGRATFEHRQERTILLRELIERAGLPPDQPAYQFVNGDQQFTLARVTAGLNRRGLPDDLLPRFVPEPPVYVEGQPAPDRAPPVRVEVSGTPRRGRLWCLRVYFRLI